MRSTLPVLIVSALVYLLSLQAGTSVAFSIVQARSISAKAVKDHLGKFVTVEDAVTQVVLNSDQGAYLNFGADAPNHVFRVIVPTAVWRQIRGPVFPQTRVRVTGVAAIGPEGIPEIVCSDIKQFVRLDASSKPVPATAMPPTQTRSCCRVCTTGKPCGDSCISRSYTCRQPPGCAC